MAFYSFDLTFVNLSNLPEGSHGIMVDTKFQDLALPSVGGGGWVSGRTDLTVHFNTAEPVNFEVDPTLKVWFIVEVVSEPTPSGPPATLQCQVLGPYVVGEIGTEIPGQA